jgi:hypothetical protein
MVDGPNLYAYVGNSPTTFTDPTGTRRGSRPPPPPPPPGPCRAANFYSYSDSWICWPEYIGYPPYARPSCFLWWCYDPGPVTNWPSVHFHFGRGTLSNIALITAVTTVLLGIATRGPGALIPLFYAPISWICSRDGNADGTCDWWLPVDHINMGRISSNKYGVWFPEPVYSASPHAWWLGPIWLEGR